MRRLIAIWGYTLIGEANLGILLASMTPRLGPDVFVFVTIPGDALIPSGSRPMMTFREPEGTTLIITEDQARTLGLSATFRCRKITLDIHSSLEAVGFIAAIAAQLAAAGMGVNPVSAYFHDHLFVPAARAEEALEILRRMGTEHE